MPRPVIIADASVFQANASDGSKGAFIPMVIVLVPNDWSTDPNEALLYAEEWAARIQVAVTTVEPTTADAEKPPTQEIGGVVVDVGAVGEVIE